MLKIGITGATGMIGTNLRRLISEEDTYRRRYWPVALIRPETNTAALRERGVEMRVVDYRDPDGFRGKLEDLDAVVHLAGLVKACRPEEFYAVNAEGTRTVLEACRRYGTKGLHFLFGSSIAACGPSPSPDSPKDEEAECVPSSHYGASKLQAERIVRACELNWTILRLPAVFGPHDYEGLRLLRMVRSGRVWAFGRQEHYLSYICAQDLSRLLLRMVLNSSVYREIVNVSYDGVVRALEFYSAIRRLLGLDPAVHLLRLPRWTALFVGFVCTVSQRVRGRASYISLDKARDLTEKYMVLTNEKMKRKLGLERFEETGALAETVKWFKDRNLL